jgi:hypothetical protein
MKYRRWKPSVNRDLDDLVQINKGSALSTNGLAGPGSYLDNGPSVPWVNNKRGAV